MRFVAAVAVVLTGVCAALAQGTAIPNTIKCDQFKKTPDGVWTENGTADFTIGEEKLKLENTPVAPRSYVVSGIDLFGLLEKKCNGKF